MNAGLYIHIPFCSHICGYCDFYTVVLRKSAIPTYLDALTQEILIYSRDSAFGSLSYETLYFGGGTPSLLSARQLGLLIDQVTGAFRFVDDPEVTLETNPGTVDLAKLQDLRAVGVNRLSLGVQSFDSHEIKALDRDHDIEDSVRAYESARGAGFENVSLDLMFGISGQRLLDWQRTLKRVTELRPDHISTYSLTYEEGTPFHKKLQKGLFEAIPCSLHREMFLATLTNLRDAGYHHYEVSSYARPTYHCRHNQKYWDGSPYLGLGVSAHSYMGNRRFWNVRDMKRYCESLNMNDLPIDGEEWLSSESRVFERVILGLRQRRGIDLNSFETEFGVCFFERFAAPLSKLFDSELTDSGLIQELKQGSSKLPGLFLTIEDGFLRFTDQGVLVSDSVYAEFV